MLDWKHARKQTEQRRSFIESLESRAGSSRVWGVIRCLNGKPSKTDARNSMLEFRGKAIYDPVRNADAICQQYMAVSRHSFSRDERETISKLLTRTRVFDPLDVAPEAPAPRRPPEQRQQLDLIQPPPEAAAPVDGTFEPPEAAPAAVEQELFVEDAPPPAPAPVCAPPRVDQGVESERKPPAKREVLSTPRRSGRHREPLMRFSPSQR